MQAQADVRLPVPRIALRAAVGLAAGEVCRTPRNVVAIFEFRWLLLVLMQELKVDQLHTMPTIDNHVFWMSIDECIAGVIDGPECGDRLFRHTQRQQAAGRSS